MLGKHAPLNGPTMPCHAMSPGTCKTHYTFGKGDVNLVLVALISAPAVLICLRRLKVNFRIVVIDRKLMSAL